MHRDEYDGASRFARRRPLRSDEREWYPPDDVGPYSFPHRPRIHEVQRPDDRTPRGYGRTPRSARSLDAFHHNMPQQPPPYLSRAPTDVQRRPRKYPVYEEDDEPDDVWHNQRIRASASEFEPPQPRRPRQRLRAKPVPVPEPEPEPPSSDSPPSDSETESETESESESDDEDHIEVVEEHSDDDDDDDEDDEDDDEDEVESHHPHRHHRLRQHRHTSRDVYMNSSQDQKRRHRSRRSRPPSLSDVEIEVEEYEPTIPDVASPRQILARRQNSESPKYDHHSRVASVIETSRPPVATRRLVSGEMSLPPPAPRSDHRIRTIKIYDARDAHREGRPRRSPSAHSSRQQSRSSSRQAPSLLGSNFGDSSRQSSPERPAKIRDCNVCLSEVPTSKCPKLKCGHHMCNSCLKQRFKSSLNEPQNFPPKCCRSAIDPALVENLLDRSFKKQWNRRYAELAEADVKSRHPVYCTSKRCGAWIKPHHIHHDRVAGKKIAQCSHCDTKVCVNCNTKWHYPKRCPSDPEMPKYLEQAHEEGWKRCYKCKNMVELKDGRSHMICRCGARFCVVCGIKWRKCDCPLFSYEGESDHPDHTVQSTPKSRRAIELDPEHSSPQSPGERRAGRGLPPIRPQPKSYEEEVMLRQFGEQRDGKVARKLQYISEGEFDPMVGPGDMVVAKGPKHYMHDPFVHDGGAPAAPLGAADTRHGYERGPGGEYAGRSKRGRGKSIEQRLADRFAETRQVPGSMPGMEPPAAVMGHHMGPPMMPPPPMGMPPPVAENGYAPGGRVIVEQELEYEDDGASYFSHSSRSRARSRRRARRSAGGGEPKSSLLAGLGGRGTGMGRVDLWRKYVQPGDFEGEIASAAVAATTASA